MRVGARSASLEADEIHVQFLHHRGDRSRRNFVSVFAALLFPLSPRYPLSGAPVTSQSIHLARCARSMSG